jgi:hypothetical protein
VQDNSFDGEVPQNDDIVLYMVNIGWKRWSDLCFDTQIKMGGCHSLRSWMWDTRCGGRTRCDCLR